MQNEEKDHSASLGSDALASPAITEAHPTKALALSIIAVIECAGACGIGIETVVRVLRSESNKTI